jgi:hypothetical protein
MSIMGNRRLIAATAGTFALATLLTCCGLGASTLWRHDAAPVLAEETVPMTGSVVLAVDGTLHYSVPPACDGTTGTATVSTDRVTVRLTRHVLSFGNCPLAATPLVVSIPMSEPLGDRRVVDATTGAVLPVFVERGALHPTVPPVPGSASPPFGEDGSLAPGFGGPGSATLAEAFLGPNYPPDIREVVWIVQTTGAWNRPPGLVTKPVTVRGHRGEQAPTILVWTENGQTVAVVWQPPPDRAWNGPVLLDIANRLARTDVTG